MQCSGDIQVCGRPRLVWLDMAEPHRIYSSLQMLDMEDARVESLETAGLTQSWARGYIWDRASCFEPMTLPYHGSILLVEGQ